MMIGLQQEVDQLLKKLYPICRSITGNGVRESMAILKEVADFDVKEIPSGTTCYDWTVPAEWNIRDAYILDDSGNKIVDFQISNVHVMSYSEPVNKKVSFAELDEHLHFLEDVPNAIPYRTSYYKKDWGFCISYEQYKQLDREANYRVYIDSDFNSQGSLTYGEKVLPGENQEEILITSYCCHPSLANDNLSGMVLWALLLKELQSSAHRYTYRFALVPETIGAIAYLSKHQEAMKNVAGGFVLTTNAGPGEFGYKESFLGNSVFDEVVLETFKERNINFKFYPFDIHGSDERQFSSPGFRLPMVTVTKDKYYEYKYYHTSLDDLSFISPAFLIESLSIYLAAIEKLEMNQCYLSLNPFCEPMLSKRDLYSAIGGKIKQYSADGNKSKTQIDAICQLMFHSDGTKDLLEISKKSAIAMEVLDEVAKLLIDKKLLRVAVKG